MGFENFLAKDWSWTELQDNMNELAIVIANPNLPDCPIIFVNDKFLEHCGYSLNEIVGRNCRFMPGPNTEPEAVELFRHSIRTREPVNVVINNYRKDGTMFRNNVLMRPLEGEQSLIVAVQRRIG